MTAGRISQLVSLTALCAVILVLAEMTYVRYREMQTGPIPVVTLPAETIDSLQPREELAVTLSTVDELMAVVERPIFSPSRRPAEVSADATEQASASDFDLDLVGIVIWKAQRVALVRSSSDPKIVRIEVGGNVAGWVAIGIEPEYVRFRNGETEKEVRLKYVNRDDNG
jgi:hypothetical protein